MRRPSGDREAVAGVTLWGRTIGAVSADEGGIAAFEYDPEFIGSGIELSPIRMPLGDKIYRFPSLSRERYQGLPGLLAGSLPGPFGNSLIEAWLLESGIAASRFDAVGRLGFVGDRGCGALEYRPGTGPTTDDDEALEIASLVELAETIVSGRRSFTTSFAAEDHRRQMRQLLSVGSSTRGLRPRAAVAWNPSTNRFHAGDAAARDGYSDWLLRFDGLSATNADRRATSRSWPGDDGAVEFAYYRMARACGVEISEVRLLEDGARRHLMSRRVDRTDSGGKLHMQTFEHLAHLDRDRQEAPPCEQALLLVRHLGLSVEDLEQLFRRIAFNVIARNQNDHVGKIAFLMDRSGEWSLSPAFGVSFAFDPGNPVTREHRMSLNGKRDDFTLDDFKACASEVALMRGRAEKIVDEVQRVVSRWGEFAGLAGVDPAAIERIGAAHRTIV